MQEIFPRGFDFSRVPPLNHFDRGTPCLVDHEDGLLYRGEVLGRDGDVVHVCFVDFGLTQPIDDEKKLLMLPNRYKVLPRQAIACTVPSMPGPVEAGLPGDEYVATLANIIGTNKFLCSVLDGAIDSLYPSVEFHLDDAALSELVNEALAIHDYEPLWQRDVLFFCFTLFLLSFFIPLSLRLLWRERRLNSFLSS